MNKTLRMSEKWYRRALWLVAVLFASFLIGLGSAIVEDLPRVEQAVTLNDYIDQSKAASLRSQIAQAQEQAKKANEELGLAQLKLSEAQANTEAEQANFNNWTSTRNSTRDPGQDASLKARTAALEHLQSIQRQALQQVQNQEGIALNAQQSVDQLQGVLNTLEETARGPFERAQAKQELRVFAYRLALTLPLLLLAAWLLLKKRQSTHWPFVWGYAMFAVFVFFVELVPYLPSYGGYVRQVVGIVLTVVGGRYAILAMNRYLERQKLAEAIPEKERRQSLDYDLALGRLAKSVCPGCERPLKLQDESLDFCPHCGIGLHHRCPACQTRKSCFSRYCHSCGEGNPAEST